MKKLILSALLMAGVCAEADNLTITPIYRFPTAAQPPDSYLFLMSAGGSGNYKISYAQLKANLSTNQVSWSTYPSSTNALTLNNSYWHIDATNDVAITNLTGNGISSTLMVNNTNGSAGITLRMRIGHAGLNSTNALLIPSGKQGIVSFLVYPTHTNYCTTTFQ